MKRGTIVSGPIFEPEQHGGMVSVLRKKGGHYNVYAIDAERKDGGGKVNPEIGMVSLRQMFPDEDAINSENFVLFSTSGIHGTYTTIEEIEAALEKYGDEGPVIPEGEDPPDDWMNRLTVLIVQPRLVCMRYGVVRVRQKDVYWLKRLREASWRAVQQIGAPAPLS